MTFDPHAFVASQQWTFAKTMPQNPHEYIVRGKGNDPEDFDAFVKTIRTGEKRVWGRKIYIYWKDQDGMRYWTMGWPVWYEGAPRNGYTYIINRVLPHNDRSERFNPDIHSDLRYSSPDGKHPVT